MRGLCVTLRRQLARGAACLRRVNGLYGLSASTLVPQFSLAPFMFVACLAPVSIWVCCPIHLKEGTGRNGFLGEKPRTLRPRLNLYHWGEASRETMEVFVPQYSHLSSGVG